jgi:hypothetical protein
MPVLPGVILERKVGAMQRLVDCCKVEKVTQEERNYLYWTPSELNRYSELEQAR